VNDLFRTHLKHFYARVAVRYRKKYPFSPTLPTLLWPRTWTLRRLRAGAQMRQCSILSGATLLVILLAFGSSWCQQPLPTLDTRGLHASEDAAGNAIATAASARSTHLPATATPASGDSPRGPLALPESLFDAVDNHFAQVITSVEVHGEGLEAENAQPAPYVAGGQEVLSTAGAFGDVSRFLQIIPGVVASSDLSNEFFVRGGHPMENLFLVDGIEVPNINHLATLGTTGGFGPMIDTGVIQGVELYTGGYEARYPERLSSITEIRTLEPRNLTGHAEGDAGIEGFGGLVEKRWNGSDLLASAHHGLLELMNGFGINGLPAYTNEMARYRLDGAPGNRVTLLHLAGWDSIQIANCPIDPHETNTIDSQYAGWRETTGAEWQRAYSKNSFAVASISDSEQIEHINQQDQLIDPTSTTLIPGPCPAPASFQATPVYSENSNNAFSTASYRYEWSGSRFALTTGGAVWLQRPHYEIDQPLGAYSPYSADPVRADSASFASFFSTGESGSYAQFTVRPLRSLELSAGGRLQTFAFGDHRTLTPRLSMRYSLSESVGIHLAFASYAQMPPYVYLLSYPENRSMSPMRSTHEVVGMDIGFVPSSEIRIEAYNKVYRDIPASTEYPSVNLHNMVDMIAQQIVWLPMNSGGRGNSSGIEVSDSTRIRSELVVRGSIAYSRAMFSGLDRVMRPSNFDFPWIVNIAALERFGHGYEFSTRYGYATGRPYTPFDLPDSLAQNRPIYDVTEMNALRVPYYGRLDVQINKDAVVRGLHLELYVGVNNVLNRSNFLSYVWMSRFKANDVPGNPVGEIDQMPIFPNFGLRYIFR